MSTQLEVQQNASKRESNIHVGVANENNDTLTKNISTNLNVIILLPSNLNRQFKPL